MKKNVTKPTGKQREAFDAGYQMAENGASRGVDLTPFVKGHLAAVEKAEGGFAYWNSLGWLVALLIGEEE